MRYNLISLCSDLSWQPSRSGLLRWQRVVANLVCTAVLSDRSADGVRLFSQSMFNVALRPSLQMQVLLRIRRLKDQKWNQFFNRNICWPYKYWSYTWTLIKFSYRSKESLEPDSPLYPPWKNRSWGKAEGLGLQTLKMSQVVLLRFSEPLKQWRACWWGGKTGMGRLSKGPSAFFGLSDFIPGACW